MKNVTQCNSLVCDKSCNTFLVTKMPRKQAQKADPKYTIYKYAVVRVENEDEREKLFECIPDRWFVDENKTSCFWPPMIGKPFHLRAISCERPDDSWAIYECTVISDGHCKFYIFLLFLR